MAEQHYSFDSLDKRYLRIDGTEHRKLMTDIKLAKEEAAEAKKSSWRTERYLVGGLDEHSGKYTMGMSPKLTTVQTLGYIILVALIPILIHAVMDWVKH